MRRLIVVIAFFNYFISSTQIDMGDIATDAVMEAASSLNSTCESTDPSYKNSVRISEDVRFFWTVDEPFLHGSLRYNGIGWIGIGIADSSGSMIGADAIIGNPDLSFEDNEDSISVLKYDIDSIDISGIVPMEESMQTLAYSSLTQDSNTTVLTFTKLMKEESENEILSSGTNSFIWAVGSSNTFAQKLWENFDLDLSKCHKQTPIALQIQEAAEIVMSGDGPIPNGFNKKALVVHFVFFTLAWCVCAPFAVAAAWFRRLVPTWWIYVHVGANVLCFIFTLIAFIIWICATAKLKYTSPLFTSYNVVGLIMMFFTTTQVVNGFMRPPVEKMNSGMGNFGEEARSRSPRQVWHTVHRFSGVSLLIISVYQVSTGITLFSELFGTKNICPIYWTTVGIFLLAVIVIKLSMVVDLRSQDVNDNSKQIFSDVEFSSN